MKGLGRLVLVLGVLLVGGQADAATFYVSKLGNNANTCASAQGTRQADQKLTITAGIACLASGDTLLVHAGTYNEAFNNPNIASGSSGAYTRIAAYPGTNSPNERDPSLAGHPAGWEVVWVTPDVSLGAPLVWYFQANQRYIEWDGININSLGTGGAFKVDSAGPGNNPHHLRYKNAEIQYGTNDPGGANNAFLYSVEPNNQSFIGFNESINLHVHADVGGIQSGDVIGYTHYIVSSDNVVAGCNLHNAGSSAVQVNNDHGSRARRNIIRSNWIHDIVLTYFSFNAYWAIITDVDDDTAIYNNVVWNIGVNNGDQIIAINVFGSVRTLIYNNTLYGINASNETGIYVGLNSSGTVIRNTISFNHTTDYANFGSGTVADHNLLGANPNFVSVSPSNRNFQLGTGSPGIDTGTQIALVATDVTGRPRPQGNAYDLGAYEGTGAAGGTSPPHAPTSVHISAKLTQSGTVVWSSLGLLTFTASAQHVTTNAYTAKLYASGTTTPVIDTLDLGKPDPSGTTSLCARDIATWLGGQTAGDYEVRVSAVNGDGANESSQSNAFTVPLVAE